MPRDPSKAIYPCLIRGLSRENSLFKYVLNIRLRAEWVCCNPCELSQHFKKMLVYRCMLLCCCCSFVFLDLFINDTNIYKFAFIMHFTQLFCSADKNKSSEKRKAEKHQQRLISIMIITYFYFLPFDFCLLLFAFACFLSNSVKFFSKYLIFILA